MSWGSYRRVWMLRSPTLVDGRSFRVLGAPPVGETGGNRGDGWRSAGDEAGWCYSNGTSRFEVYLGSRDPRVRSLPLGKSPLGGSRSPRTLSWPGPLPPASRPHVCRRSGRRTMWATWSVDFSIGPLRALAGVWRATAPSPTHPTLLAPTRLFNHS